MSFSKSQALLDAVEQQDVLSVSASLASLIDVNTRDKGGSTPLMRAALHGNLKIAELLIAAGAALDVQDKLGKTALHYAAQEQHRDVVKCLIEAGANINCQDEQGNSPLSMAVFYSRGAGETIKLLREKGANDNLANKHGVTPVGLAKTIANCDVLKFFADK